MTLNGEDWLDHVAGDPECVTCAYEPFTGKPEPCKCGGLVHFNHECDEPDCWTLSECDRCDNPAPQERSEG